MGRLDGEAWECIHLQWAPLEVWQKEWAPLERVQNGMAPLEMGQSVDWEQMDGWHGLGEWQRHGRHSRQENQVEVN